MSMFLSFPFTSDVGCWAREIAVPWNESLKVVELGLWSILSTAAVVNNLFHTLDGQTTASLSYLAVTLLAMSVEIDSTLS